MANEPSTAVAEENEDELYGDYVGESTEKKPEKKIPAEDAGESSFYNNLAEDLGDSELKALASKLIDLVTIDKEARSKRDDQYKKGLERTGAGVEAPGGAEFDGASKATHPVLLECCIDFSASAIKEIFPADGPCRIKTFDDAALGDDMERIERVKSFMNYQLTTEIEEYEETLDETLSQVPLGGSQYMKWWWDAGLDRPRVESVFQDDLFLPFSEPSFWNAKRKTIRMYLTRQVIEERIRNGMYRDIAISSHPQTPEFDVAAEAAQKIEGVSDDGYNEDGLREVYEVYLEHQLEDDDRPYPYIVTIDVNDQDVYSIYRNWEEHDETCRAMDWIVEFPFVKWRGAYSLGFAHIIGGLAAATTGALRALLDSAHINNAAAVLKLKGGRVTGQSQTVNVTGVTEIVGAAGVDDIRKIAMPVPFNPPSPMLYQLLGFLTDAAKGIVSVAEEKLADASNNGPVGTTLALIEQGSKVFSAIHKRLHRSQKKSLAILYRLNRMYLTRERVIDELGKLAVKPDDFAGPCWIIPVSDPNIFSEAQRVAQIQAVLQLYTMAPQFYDGRAVQKRALNLLKIPDADSLLVHDNEPEELNPVAENIKMAFGQGAVAYPMQDHFAHIQTHLMFMQDPVFGQNPLIGESLVAPMAEHLKQHLVFSYARMMYDAASDSAGQPIDDLMKDKDPDTRAAFDQLMAAVSIGVGKASGQAFSGALQPMMEAYKKASAMKPPPPMDPSAVAAMDVQRQSKKDEQELALKGQEVQAKVGETQARTSAEQQKAASTAQKTQLDAQQKAGDQKLVADREQNRKTEAARKLALEAKTQEEDRMLQQAQLQIDQIMQQRQLEAEAARNQQDNITALAIAEQKAQDAKEKVGNMTSGKGTTNPSP